jgi:hypothetical protein
LELLNEKVLGKKLFFEETDGIKKYASTQSIPKLENFGFGSHHVLTMKDLAERQ